MLFEVDGERLKRTDFPIYFRMAFLQIHLANRHDTYKWKLNTQPHASILSRPTIDYQLDLYTHILSIFKSKNWGQKTFFLKKTHKFQF